MGVKFTNEEFIELMEMVKMEKCDGVRINNSETISLAEWRVSIGCVNLVKYSFFLI